MSDLISRDAAIAAIEAAKADFPIEKFVCDEFARIGLSRAALEVTALPSPWLSVKDRLPENGVRVLVYCHNDPYTTIASYCATEGYGCFREISIGHGYIYYHDVSHWQPLPAPPSD